MYKYPYFKVDVYSHFFKLVLVTPRGREVLNEFIKDYVLMGFVKEGRQWVRRPLKVFAARIRDGSEYRFHINQLPAFKQFLANQRITDDLVPTETFLPPMGVPANVSILPTWSLRDYQIPIHEYLGNILPSPRKFVDLQTGKGKAQRLDAKIKVPGGWSTMGEMYVGKEITSITGETQKVIGVYPQGLRQMYRVTFADGRSVEADEEHLWKVYYVNTVKHKRWRVVTTLELLRLISMPNPRVYVPLPESEKSPTVDLPIDPYLLGVILGDGGITAGSISITKSNPQLFKNIESRLPENIVLTPRDEITSCLVAREGRTNDLIDKLRELGLMGKASHEKFIPEQYLNASHSQRLALVQGLMDTDGTANTRETGGAISFCSTSKVLAEQMQYLIRSLEGIASISVRNPHYTYKNERKEGRQAYDVNIRYKRPSELFTIDAKKSRTNDRNQYAERLKLRVTSVEKTELAQAQCITVDSHEKLYITNDFIVTHNTFIAVNFAASLKTRIAVVLKPGYIEKWVKDFKKICGMEKKEILVIQGGASLMQLIANAKEGILTHDVIIFSNRTLQLWFKAYEQEGANTLLQGYDCLPEELFPLIGVGVRIIDETHQDFHLNFKMDLYCHCAVTVSLSATLISDDPFIARMHDVAYPKEHRFSGLVYDRYIEAYSFIYNVNQPNKLRTTEWGSTNYSHHAFEESVIKNPVLLQGYMDMIVYALQRYYYDGYTPGNRALVYCASIDMCTRVKDYLKVAFPDKDVRRYVQEDPYENLMEAEISVSTLLSAGTGHDIDLLSTVILTTAVSSSASNIQGFGRLRNLPGIIKRFVYFVCADVPKHMDYHNRKKELLLVKALKYTSYTHFTRIG